MKISIKPIQITVLLKTIVPIKKLNGINGMNSASTGWMLFIAAMGMMCTLLASDVAKLASWNEAISPSFVALMLAHIGVVITAFVGGKIIPPDRSPQARDRVSDNKLQELNQKSGPH